MCTKTRKTRAKNFIRITRATFRNHTPTQYRAQEITPAEFEERAAPHGPLFVGSPQEIIDKIMYQRELFAHQRFLAQTDIGGLPYAKVGREIELIATEIAPVVRSKVEDQVRPAMAG
jgi:alkanesulfonate monooxygenase SsuD/methylene tetrahydromethanopterin reductase-like flavin-dependent oxidoreductase (luciferase family)